MFTTYHLRKFYPSLPAAILHQSPKAFHVASVLPPATKRAALSKARRLGAESTTFIDDSRRFGTIDAAGSYKFTSLGMALMRFCFHARGIDVDAAVANDWPWATLDEFHQAVMSVNPVLRKRFDYCLVSSATFNVKTPRGIMTHSLRKIPIGYSFCAYAQLSAAGNADPVDPIVRLASLRRCGLTPDSVAFFAWADEVKNAMEPAAGSTLTDKIMDVS